LSSEETTTSSGPFEDPKPDAAVPPADPEPAEQPRPSSGPFEGPKPETIESPVGVKSTPSYRLALGAVIILAVLIVAGIGVLIVGIVKGWGHRGEAASAAAAAGPAAKPVSMSLAPGFRILSSDTQPGRLILHMRSDTVDEIAIIDLNDGHIIARIDAQAPR